MNTIRYLFCLLALLTVRANAQTTLEVWSDNSTEINADGTTVTYLTFYQKDPNVNYIAFNMTITVPKGIHINQKITGREYANDIELSSRATTTHSIACNMPDENTIKIISTSSELQEFYPDDEDGNTYYPLFKIGLVGDATMYNGEYPVEISDILFGYRDHEDGQLKHNDPEPIYTQMILTGGQVFPGIDYVLSSHQWGTLILPFKCDIPDGLSVYTCDGISDDNKLLLNKQSSLDANTPYIISGTAGNYHLNGTYCALKDSYSTDYLTGVYIDTEVPKDAFVLQNQAGSNTTGFYRVGEETVKCPAYRCYLNPLSSDVMMYPLNIDDEETGINMVRNEEKSSSVYTIDGKYLGNDIDKNHSEFPHGLYIKNKKKLLK